MKNLQEIVDSLSSIEEKPYVIGSFLDSARNNFKKGLINEEYFSVEPIWDEQIDDNTRAAFAGYCHSLCHEFGFKVPKWLFHSKYYLKDPYFANNATGMLRVALLIESPTEFSSRNVYFSENCMSRA